MNSSDAHTDSATDSDTKESINLYAGDTGELALDTRRVIVQLLSGPSLDGRRHTKLWPVLAREEAIVRSRLSELFLDLVVDHEQQVAFSRQADVGELEAPVLLRRSPLTFIDSLLLLFLRGRLTHADTHGERATVDAAEIDEHLSMYERATSTDSAGFLKKVQASIEKMKKNSILQKIRGSEGRFEVSPTLKLLFSAEEVQALTRQYGELATGSRERVAADPEAEDESE